MNETELIELARAYVALSNAHRTDLIEPMFKHDSVYRSSAVGEHVGAAAIIAMMQAFFKRYSDVHWRVDDYRCHHDSVSFDFDMTASNSENGEPLRRRGKERIDFDAAGGIKLLEVETA